MFPSFQIATLAGIPLRVNISWFIIFALVTLSLIVGQFPSAYPNWEQSAYIGVGLATSMLFFASVIAHELAHSLVARKLGVPVRNITLFIFGGVAQITRDVPMPSGELLMAAAGPMCSFVLSALFAVGWLITRPISEPAAALTGWLAWINLSLGIFNLLPGFPMDGGRVLRSILWWSTGNHRMATRIALLVGQAVALLFIIGGIALVLRAPGASFNGIWIAFIGWFLHQAASNSSRQNNFRNALQGYTVRNLMNADVAHVTPQTTLNDFMQNDVSSSDRGWYLATEGSMLKGLVNVSSLTKVAQKRWGTATVAEVMTPAQDIPVVHPDTDILIATEMMEDQRARELLVVEEGELRGVVTQGALFRLAQIRRGLRR